jgi:hypothetical protein
MKTPNRLRADEFMVAVQSFLADHGSSDVRTHGLGTTAK